MAVAEDADTTSPAAPWTPDLVAESDTGSSNTDNVTADNTPTFAIGGLESDSTVRLYADQTVVSTEVVPTGMSTVSVTTSMLADGVYAITATATDLAGNTSPASAPLAPPLTVDTTYTVDPWTLQGFYEPVDMNGEWNSVKGGSTVPLKFEVFAGPTELTDSGAIEGFTVKGVPCPTTGVTADDIELTTTGGTTLRYDSATGQFIQNWKTPKKPGVCYQVTLTTDDGSSLTANFQIR